MRVLIPGSEGKDVRRWQLFLMGQGFAPRAISGALDAPTVKATRAFQARYKLDVDGRVGNQTLGKAMMLGFEALDYAADESSGYPAEPDFSPLTGLAARQKVFGKFAYVAAPEADNREAIRITDGWAGQNIVRVDVPQVSGVRGAPASGRIYCHTLAAAQLQALFKAWDKAGLMDRVLAWGGSYAPRFIRGSTSVLSHHAFGSAFEINVANNPLGAEPAYPTQKGCVFDLVPLAHEHGFYWGGHFASRRDGMHFEIAEVR